MKREKSHGFCMDEHHNQTCILKLSRWKRNCFMMKRGYFQLVIFRKQERYIPPLKRFTIEKIPLWEGILLFLKMIEKF